MKNIIKNWTSSKNTNDFNYVEALKTLVKDKSIESQSIEEYLHFDLSNQVIQEKLNAINNLNLDYLTNILELVNHYHYYLKMNSLIKKDNDNIKKLNKINKLFDEEFINFLDRYLDLDKTILSSNESLKIEDNFEDVIKYYLEYDFKFALNELEKFLNHSQRKDSLSITDKDLTNSLIIKPKTKSYLKPIGKRAILKCLYFDLLFLFEDITKEQSIDIIKEFFELVLEDKKSEHTLTKDSILLIKEEKHNLYKIVNNYYVFDLKSSANHKTIPKNIKDIKEIFNTKAFIYDNFTPYITINYK